MPRSAAKDNLWKTLTCYSGPLGSDWLESPPVAVAPNEEYVAGFTLEPTVAPAPETHGSSDVSPDQPVASPVSIEAEILVLDADAANRTHLESYTCSAESQVHRRWSVTAPAGVHSLLVRLRSSRPAALSESYFARKIEDIGEPVKNAAIVSGVFGRMNGRLHFYTIRVGSTSVGSLFCVTDVETGQLIDSAPLDAMGSNTLFVDERNESVYIGGYHSGKLYRYAGVGGGIEDLGHPEPDSEFTFSLTAGPDGSIVGGTWPKCRLFRYDSYGAYAVESPSGSGKSFVENTNYLRGLIYDSPTDSYIVGTGTPAGLFVFPRGATWEEAADDARAGRRLQEGLVRRVREVCAEQTAGKQFVGRLFLYGEYLFVSLLPGELLVARVERVAGSIADIRPLAVFSPFDVRSGIAEPVDGVFFYSSSGRLTRCDLETLESTQVIDTNGADVVLPVDVQESILATQPEPTLYFAGSNIGRTSIVRVSAANLSGQDGGVFAVPPVGRADGLAHGPVTVTEIQLSLPPAPTDIRTLAVGPRGEILASAFRLGGLGIYNPFFSGSLSQRDGLGQCEGIVTTPEGVFAGVYPEARIYRWGPDEEWSIDIGGHNPALLFYVEYGQDRPFGMAYAAGKVFAAVTPVYGSNEGSLVVFNAARPTDRRVYLNIVPKQSPISLAVSGSVVCGGTSVWGGLGIQPETEEAELFAVDAETERLLYRIVPVEGRRAITGLLTREDGLVWGMDEGVLFVCEPLNGEILYRKDILPHIVYDGSHNIHFDANLIEGPDGLVYVAAGGKICSVDTESMAVTVLAESDAKLLVADRFGHLYYTTQCGRPLGGTGGAMLTRYMVVDEH